ncbi:hypothetical protein ABPG75_008808 [Micractinium tetrahymenae]
MTASWARAEQDSARILKPDTPRRAESAPIGGEPVRYRPVGLQQGAGYEVRVSFPGTIPVRLRLWLEAPAAGSGSNGGLAGSRRELWLGSGGGRGGRKLLDAEKIVFSTDAQGCVWLEGEGRAFSAVDVMLRAEPWGRWRHPQQAPKQLVYDIVLERSTLGVPHSALPVLLCAVVLALLAAAAVPWWAGKGVPAILHWLHGGPAAASVSSPRPWRTPLLAS